MIIHNSEQGACSTENIFCSTKRPMPVGSPKIQMKQVKECWRSGMAEKKRERRLFSKRVNETSREMMNLQI